MKKYSICICLIVCFLLCVSCTQAGSSEIVLRMGHPMAPGDNVAEGYEKFKALVEKKSNKGIRVEIFGDTRLGSDRVTMQAAMNGMLDMSSCSSSNLAMFQPEFMALDLPYITSQKYQQNFYRALDEGELGKYIEGLVNKMGLTVLMFSEYGYRNFASTRKPLQNAASLQGLNVRTTDSPVEVAVAQALGMNPAPVPWGDTYMALKQGSLDAEGNTFSLLYAGKHYEVLRYAMNSAHNYSLHILLMNKERWEELTPQQQKLVREAAHEALNWQRGVSGEIERKAWQDMEAKGVQITRLSQAEMQKLRDLTAPVRESFAHRAPTLLRLIEETQR